jgi:hypothetical protein
VLALEDALRPSELLDDAKARRWDAEDAPMPSELLDDLIFLFNRDFALAPEDEPRPSELLDDVLELEDELMPSELLDDVLELEDELMPSKLLDDALELEEELRPSVRRRNPEDDLELTGFVFGFVFGSGFFFSCSHLFGSMAASSSLLRKYRMRKRTIKIIKHTLGAEGRRCTG